MHLHRDNPINLLSVGVNTIPGKRVFKARIRFKHLNSLNALDVDFEVDQGEICRDGVWSHLDENDGLVALRLTAVVDKMDVGTWDFNTLL